MARIPKEKVHEVLDAAAARILKAGGPDGIVSRRDFRRLLFSLGGDEWRLVNLLYRFMDHRDYRPGARITRADIEDSLDYIKTKLIDAYDLDDDGLSPEEVAEMSALGKYAVQLARALMDQSSPRVATGLELKEKLEPLLEGLFLFGFGSEGDYPFEAFHREASLDKLHRDTFAQALELDLDDPEQAIQRYVEDTSAFQRDFQAYHRDFREDLGEPAAQVARLLEKNLRDRRIFILGLDDWRVYPRADHPWYWVGIAPDGSLAGLRSQVIWT
jgi:hypothetical protein